MQVFKINIDKPCSVSWESMTISEQGRYCQKCSHEVVDFTLLSNNEIELYLKSKMNQKACGRFYKKQLEKIEIIIHPAIFYSTIPEWKKYLIIFLIVFGNEITNANFIFANNIISIE
jgi:hypothetical protein